MESIMTLCVLKWLCGNRNRWHNSLDLQLIADIARMQHFINGPLKQWTSTDFYRLHTWSNWCSHSSSGIELELRIPALSLAFRGIPIGVGPDNFIFAVFSDHHCVLVILIHSLVSDLPYRAFLNSRVNSSGFDVSILAISNLLWLFFHWYNFLLALKLVLIVFNEWKA